MNSVHLDGTAFYSIDLEKGYVDEIKIPPISDEFEIPIIKDTPVKRNRARLRSSKILPPNGFR